LKLLFKSPFNILILILLLTGTFLHFAPLFNEQRLLYSITEDGYYMLTIARNIAEGHGMTIADGTIPTNGTQPLVTLIMSGIFMLFDGDKIMPIRMIVIFEWITASLSFLLLWKIGSRLLKDRPNGKQIALFAAALWYAGPLTLLHTMNGLETGLYLLAILFIINLIVFRDHYFTLRFSILLGFLLGITFWIRNDAVLLISAICLVMLFPAVYPMRMDFIHRIGYVLTIGFISFIAASPWLIYNQFKFGRIMPMSGYAQMIDVPFGGNLVNLPRILAEYFLVIIPIPYAVQKYAVVQIFCILVLIAAIVLLFRVYKKFELHEKRLILISGIFLLLLCGFYGLFFDSYYFLPRHLFPASVFITQGWSVLMFFVLSKLKPNIIKTLSGLAFIVIIIIISVIRFNQANMHMHFQVVNWVKNNVGDSVWVASMQSGTLGYFHNRTINLDGKVNPEALRARQRNRLPEYVYNKKVMYLVDWTTMAGWIEDPVMNKNFTMIVNDPVLNLTVFKRKDTAE
jgi:hypothetical protein